MRITDKPDPPSLTKFVIFSITMLLIFTAVVLAYSWMGMEIPETLITCFYGVFGGEILMCALIKIFKIREEKEDEDDEYSG